MIRGLMVLIMTAGLPLGSFSPLSPGKFSSFCKLSYPTKFDKGRLWHRFQVHTEQITLTRVGLYGGVVVKHFDQAAVAKPIVKDSRFSFSFCPISGRASFGRDSMKNFANKVERFLKSEDGPTAVEYAVMLSLIVVVCLTAITSIGSNANSTFNKVATQLGT